jgi:hypothetical protein
MAKQVCPGASQLFFRAVAVGYAQRHAAVLLCPEDVVHAIPDHQGFTGPQLRASKDVTNQLYFIIQMAVQLAPVDAIKVVRQAKVFQDSFSKDERLCRRHIEPSGRSAQSREHLRHATVDFIFVDASF